jgi:hypothetical protein
MDVNPKAIQATTTSKIIFSDKSVEHMQSDDMCNKAATKRMCGTSMGESASLSPKIFIPDDTLSYIRK